jgi:hypothetical protein
MWGGGGVLIPMTQRIFGLWMETASRYGGWTIGVLGFESKRGLGIFLFTTASRTALGPTQPPIQWVPGAIALGVKRLGREDDQSPSSSAEVKNVWSCTSTPPIRLHDVVLCSAQFSCVRSVAMKFTEWFYCKPHTCILTAYWEGSPSKCSPWVAMHLAQRCCHCWKHFWESCCVISFSTFLTYFRRLQTPEIFVPLRQALFLETAITQLIRSQIRGIGRVFHFSNRILGQKLLDRERIWAVALSWWRIQSLVEPKFGPFPKHSFT